MYKKMWFVLVVFLTFLWLYNDKIKADNIPKATNVSWELTDANKKPIEKFWSWSYAWGTNELYDNATFTVYSKDIKKGNKILIGSYNTTTNAHSWDAYRNVMIMHDHSVFDEHKNKVGTVSHEPVGPNGDFNVYFIPSIDTKDKIGTQTFYIFAGPNDSNGNYSGMNYNSAPFAFDDANGNNIDGTITLYDPNGKKLNSYPVHIEAYHNQIITNFDNSQAGALVHDMHSASEENYHHSATGAGTTIRGSDWMFHKQSTRVPYNQVRNVNDIDFPANPSTAVQFSEELTTNNGLTNPISFFCGDWRNNNWHTNDFNRIGGSIVRFASFDYQAIDKDGNFLNSSFTLSPAEYLFETNNQMFDYNIVQNRKYYFIDHRVENNLSTQQLQSMIKDINQPQAYSSFQTATNTMRTVYNLPKAWLSMVSRELLTKRNILDQSISYHVMNLKSKTDTDKAIQRMIAFYRDKLNYIASFSLPSMETHFTNQFVKYHIQTKYQSLNQSGEWNFTASEDYFNKPTEALHWGQSGIIVHYVDVSKKDSPDIALDNLADDTGKNVTITPKNSLNVDGKNYVLASNIKTINDWLGNPISSNKIITKTTTKGLPSEMGKWDEIFIPYVPLEAPTKSASNSKYNELNEHTNVFPGSKLTYHINQPISATYDSVELKDTLDKNLSFDKAGSSLSIGGSKYSLDDKNVVSSLTYAGNTVDVSINKNFLAKKDLIGQTLTLNLAVKVSEDKRDGTIKNIAVPIVNDFEQKTNEVTIPVTPPPTIPPVKAVNKTEGLKYGDKLTYTITQKVHTLDENIGEKYKSFVLKDVIPSDLRIDSVKFFDNQNHDLTNSVGSLSTANNNVVYSLTSSFLNAMPMQGETYTLKIDTTYLPRHQVHVNDQLTNKAVTLQDKNSVDSNTVITKVKPTDPVIKKTTTYTGIMDSTKDNRVHYQIKASYGDAHDTTGVGIYDTIPQNGTLDTNSIKVTGDLSQSSFTNRSNGKTLDLKPTTNAYNTNTTVDFDVVYAKDSDWSDFAKYMVNPTGQISDKSYMQVPNVGELRFTDGFKLTDIAKVNVGVQMPKISEKVTQNNQALTDFLKNGKYSDNNYNGPIKYVITVIPGNYQKLNSVKVLSDINHNWLDFDNYLTKYGQANIGSNNDTHTADFSNPQSLSGKTFDLEIAGKALIKHWQHYSQLGDMIIGHSSAMQINGQNYQSNATKVQLPNIIFHNGLATKGYIKGDKMYVEHYVAFTGRAINKNDTSTKLNGSMFNGKNNDDFGVYTAGNNFKLNGTLPQNIALNERVIYKYTFVFDKAYILNNHNFEINEDANLKKMLTTDNKPVLLNTLKDSNLIGGTTLGLTNADSAKVNQNFKNHTLTKDNRKQKNLWGFIKYYGLPYNDYRQYTENYTRVISEDYQLDGYDNAKVKGGYGAKLDHKLYALNYQTPDYVNDYKLGFKSLDKAFDDVNIDSNRTEFLAFDKKQPLTDAKQINNKLAEIKNGGSFEKYTGIKGMTDSEKQIMQTRENELHLMPQTQLDEISYKFNKRVLDNGHQAYDLRNTVYNENNNKNAVSNSIDGGNRNYLKDFLRNNQYRAKLTSANRFGAGNNINIDFDIMYNVYGHRYLGKAGNADNSTYDEIAIQPVISGNKAQHVEGFSQSENEWLQNNQ